MSTITQHIYTDYTCGFALVLGLNQITMRSNNPSGSGSRLCLRLFWLKMQEGVARRDRHKRVWRGNVLGGQE